MKEKPSKAGIAPYVVIRTDRAGVFAGNLENREGAEVTLTNSRRLWYWDGAASLSQIAMLGVSKPKSCKFSVPVARHTILGVIEVLETTPEAENNLKAVAEWRA